MIYLVTASKDASAYELYPRRNTGIDELLSVSKAYTSNNESDIARSFIQFDINSLPSHVTASSTILNLNSSQTLRLPISFSLYAYPVSSNWNMGLGIFTEDTDQSGSLTWNIQPTIDYTLSASLYYGYTTTKDVSLDIKNIYNYWTASGNYGLMLSHTSSVESSSLDYGYLKFYSKESNTYKQPLLRIGWDDQQYTTGSLSVVGDNEIIIKTKELKSYYLEGKLNKIKLAVRDKYPIKTFSNSFAYSTSSALPQNSYYSIIDVVTKNIIIPFSTYTKVSCDANGSYVKFDTTNFPTHRALRLEFMLDRDGITEYYQDDLTFMIK